MSVCPIQTFCECVPGSSQLKHRWSDSESAREAPAKVRPRRHDQMKHSEDFFFFYQKNDSLAMFFRELDRIIQYRLIKASTLIT